MLPYDERDELLHDLAAEHGERAHRPDQAWSRARAGLWLWGQVLRSLPALARRGWWRGWTGFSTPSERLRPGEHMFESWAIDARYALRRLRRRPTYTLLTVLTLALGVAGTAAVAGVARQLLLEPLPIRAEEEVVAFHHELSWSEAEYAFLRPELDGFEELAAFRPAGVTLLRGEAPALLVEGISATSGLFRLLGREAALGTTFRPEDEVLGSEPVVVLSQRSGSASSARTRRCRRFRPPCGAHARACRTRTGRSAPLCFWDRPASARRSLPSRSPLISLSMSRR
jgi:hypothetical protein